MKGCFSLERISARRLEVLPRLPVTRIVIFGGGGRLVCEMFFCLRLS